MTRKIFRILFVLACLGWYNPMHAEFKDIEFSLGGLSNVGVAPASEKVEPGSTFAIPANQTIYQEGKTLVGWSDGSKNYEIGEVVTVEGNMTLTPVFVDNTVSLADRTEAVTLKWIFGEKAGAPTIAVEGASKPSALLVTQATIGTEVIDVKLDIDASAGKFNNARGDEWAQTNGGTKFMIPSCKGAVISYGTYNNGTDCTVDGQSVSGTSPSFTCVAATDPVEMVVVNGGYMSYVWVVLPVVETGGKKFDNVAGTIKWTLGGYNDEVSSINDEAKAALQQSGVTFGTGLKVETASYFDVNFTKLTPATSNAGSIESVMVEYRVKSYAGVTFKPTSVSFDAVKVGTDKATVSYSYVCDGKESAVVNVDAADLLRNNGANSATAQLNHVINISADECSEFAFRYYISKTANDKNQCIGNVNINGVFNGEVLAVTQYALNVSSNIEDAGVVTAYPKADTYDEGSEVKLSAIKNFGYAFVNWTDASGKEVSTEPTFTYTVDADAEITANFKALATYELAYTVAGGANDYQVQPSPAGTMVDGKRMYEEGTTVTLTAISNPILTFTNWSDGQSSSEISVEMNGDHTDIVANFDAIDYIVGWDFYQPGNDGRPADFAAADNDAVALVMRNAEGTTSGWLDKSQAGAGGYEGRPAAVNWRTTGLGDYYWQTKVNAEAFTDIKVITAMAFNYNAYTKQNVEYSLNGEDWSPVGVITIPGNKSWTDATFSLPAEANNKSEVYIRWISDKTSEVMGTDSNNDGIALGATYIVGTAKLIDDGTAPVLTAQVPEEGSNTASINGKIVLTFDEKVKVKDGTVATLGDMQLTPSVTGKTVMFEYKNLTYATDYKFTLPAGSVMDLTDNAVAEAIIINFTTKTRPVVAKGLYDVEVSTVEELVAAIEAANSRDNNTKRFRIFLHDGTYKLPASTTSVKNGDADKNDQDSQYPDPTTYIKAPNISFIGESRDGVVITNTLVDKFISTKYGNQHALEGIGRGDVLDIEKGASGTYFQHVTIKSAMGDAAGRDIVLNDKSDHTICKDVCLWGFQDTYVSNNENSRFYFEGGLLRGRTDFLCGKGDVFYNAVTLQMCAAGGYLAVPSVPKKYGYIFKDCEIVGETSGIDGNYTLGRPWGSGTPIALYIDTKMTVKPSAVGWSEMSGGWPARFAEYNSTTSTGTVIDLKDRKKSFGSVDKSGIYSNNPVLTKEEADFYSYARVMGGDDDWDPASSAEQAPAPANVKNDGSVLSWDDNDYVFCWAVCKDGKVVAFTSEPNYDIDSADATAVYSVRAANEMGGLGEAVTATVVSSGINDINADSEVVSTVYYNLQGMRVAANTPGVLVKVDTLASGQTVTTKIVVK